MIIDNDVIRNTIQSINTAIAWVLNIRLTVLLLPLLFLNWKLFLLILPVSIAVDLIITISSTFLAYRNDIRVFQDDIKKYIDGKEVKVLEIEQLKKIKAYFTGYQDDLFNKKLDISPKEYVVIQVPDIYSYISYSFPSGYSVILVPETFNEAEKRDVALLAHEYTHAAFHNVNNVLNIEVLLASITVLLFGILLFVVNSNVLLLIWILLFFCFTLFYIKTSLHGIREIEANLFGLRYIEDTFGESDLEQVSLKLLKMRQQTFLNDKDSNYFTNKLYSSELNQIKNLVIFASLEERKKLVDRLLAQKEKEKNRTKRIKILNLLRVYRKTTSQWHSTHGIQMFPFSGVYLLSIILTIGFFWVELYHTSCISQIEIGGITYLFAIVPALLLLALLLVVMRNYSSYLSNKLITLWNKIGIKF